MNFWEHPEWDNRFNEVMMDVIKVIELGSVKHGRGSWANKDNPSIETKANCASMFRHLANEQVNPGSIDPESGVPHLCHSLCRALMKEANRRINSKGE